MVVATEDGRTAGQMLAVLHTHRTWFPPFIYTHAHAHGEGIYLSEETEEELFPLLLHALTRKLCSHHCLYIEFSELQKKMFGYRHFRRLGYFPVAWQEIYNSLHKDESRRTTYGTCQPTDRDQQEEGPGMPRGPQPGRSRKILPPLPQLLSLQATPLRAPMEYFESLSQSNEAKSS